MTDFITPLDIVKSTQITNIIWKQELKSTQDNDKLESLISAYIKCISKTYEYKDKPFEYLYQNVIDTYLDNIKI